MTTPPAQPRVWEMPVIPADVDEVTNRHGQRYTRVPSLGPGGQQVWAQENTAEPGGYPFSYIGEAELISVLGPITDTALPVDNPNQHCTSTECPYGMSHTGQWCGYAQHRRCGCPFCYPEADR